MAIKMRVLYASKKKKVKEIANIIKEQYELAFNAVDVIPPHTLATKKESSCCSSPQRVKSAMHCVCFAAS